MIDNKIVKQLYPNAEGLIYEPMLIHGSTDIQLQKACNSGDYFGQIKKDGAFYQFVKGVNNSSFLFGRTVSKKTGVFTEKISNVPHIKDALDCLPDKTVVIGEIYYPGGSSKNTVEIMGCLPAKAIERQNGKWGQIHYYLHDIIMYDGVDLVRNKVNNEMRYKILKKIFELHELNKYPFLELAEVWNDNLYKRIGDALNAGEEGMVIKKKTGVYEPGKRPDTNLKAKQTITFDCIITGFEEPTTFYYGKDIENWQYWVLVDTDENTIKMRLPIGCYYNQGEEYKAVTKPYYMGWTNARIKIGAYDENNNIINIGTVHSGISDEMKQDMSKNPEKYLNHVCEIKAMEVDKKEKTLRHGFLLNMRQDKSSEQCLMEDIFK